MNKDIQEAETYLELIAECPECKESIGVEFVEPYVHEYSEWVCDNCLTKFKYRHPEA